MTKTSRQISRLEKTREHIERARAELRRYMRENDRESKVEQAYDELESIDQTIRFEKALLIDHLEKLEANDGNRED